MTNRWQQGDVPRGDDYADQFRRLAASGFDVHGEATFVAGLGARTVLDAGCGTGRVAIELARRGIDVVGVDADPPMLAVARREAPTVAFLEADLAGLALGRRFDVVVTAGNVMIFLAPGTEAEVVARLAEHLVPGGALVGGFQLGRGYSLERYDEHAAAAGLVLEARYATWDREPYTGGDYAVSVHRWLVPR